MYPFLKFFAHAGRIRTVQILVAFQSAKFGLELLSCCYGYRPQQSWKELSRAV